MSIVITVYSSKGGVGKTTLSSNMAANIANRGNRVLIIDTDPQNSVSGVLGIELSKGLSELLNSSALIDDVIIETIHEFDFIPAGVEANRDTLKYTQLLQDEPYFVKEMVVEEIGDRYDYIIFDTPPGFNPMANSAMLASGVILGLLEADPTSYATLDLMESILSKIRDADEKAILFVINLVDIDDLSVDFETLLKFVFEDRYLFSLPYDSNIKKAVANCETIYSKFENSPYAVLLDEMMEIFIKKIGGKSGKKETNS
jgi:cellulose biosynthesis protein BcsQ